jgi:teichuronic acid biosynthesis glycosyltransferase TuaC
MHILIIPSWYPYKENPLMGIFFREQALALSEAGHQVGVISPIQKSMRGLKGYSDLICGGSYWVNDGGVMTLRKESWAIPKFHQLRMSPWLSTGMRLMDEYIATQGRPDIIHAHSMLYAGGLAAKIKQKYHIPYVITEHSSAYAYKQIRNWQLPCIQIASQEASWRLAVSKQFVKLLESLFPISGAWHYLPNMVDTEFFSNAPITDTPISKLRFVFFTAAFLTSNKSFNLLIEAFAKTFLGKDVELWIGGDGEERDRLQMQATQAGIASQIRFLGQLDRNQMRSSMQQCDAFVLPSLYETFGVVLIEALASGKPVIATKCGGPESIVNENNGFLVKPADPDALGEAMQKMVESIDQFDKAWIRADCIARFSRQAVTGELNKIYRQILK